MPKSTVLFDSECGFCRCMVNLIRSLDTGHHLFLRSFAGDYKTRRGKVIPEADLLRELHLVTSSGQVFRGYYACRRIAAALPAFWILLPLLYLPGSAVVGTPLYAWVADHRTLLSGLLAHTHLCHAAPLSQGQEAFQPPA